MNELSAEGFYAFRRQTGTIERNGESMTVLPRALLLELLSRDVEIDWRSIGRAWALGALPAALEIDSLSPERVARELLMSCALTGLGEVTLSRWGQALALEVKDAPSNDTARHHFCEVLSGFLSQCFGEVVYLVQMDTPKTPHDHVGRYLILGQMGAEVAREIFSERHSFTAVLEALHKGQL